MSNELLDNLNQLKKMFVLLSEDRKVVLSIIKHLSMLKKCVRLLMTPSSWLKMNKTTCFDVTIDGGIAHISMNRPDKMNSMIRVFWKELPDIIKEIDKNSEASLVEVR